MWPGSVCGCFLGAVLVGGLLLAFVVENDAVACFVSWHGWPPLEFNAKGPEALIVGGKEPFSGDAGFLTELLRSVDVSLSQLLEESVNIAWVYLDRSGELGNGDTARFLTNTFDIMIRRGQRNRMFLANKPIIKYRAFRSHAVPIREHA
jgi:hypothetical protein